MRTFRSIITSAAFCAISISSAPALAQDQQEQSAATPVAAENLALARQIVDLGFPEETREAAFFGTMDQMVGQMRDASLAAFGTEDEGAVAILNDWIAKYINDSKEVLRGHIPGLMDGMAKSYANMFTREELTDILAFVSTSSGQRFFELSPALIAEPNFAAANQAYMNEVMAQMPAAQTELRDQLMQYFREKSQTDEAGEG